jgi:hypothetical protein
MRVPLGKETIFVSKGLSCKYFGLGPAIFPDVTAVAGIVIIEEAGALAKACVFDNKIERNPGINQLVLNFIWIAL